MNMAIPHAADRLNPQSRQIEIFYLVGVGVEEVENVELKSQAIVEFVAGAGVENQRLLRADAIVLDQRTSAEITGTQGAEPARTTAKGYAAAGDQCGRTGDAIPHRIEIGEVSAGIGDVEIDLHPWQHLVLIGPFDADATAGPARLGGAGIADEQQFRVEIQNEYRQRTGEAFDCPGANADL